MHAPIISPLTCTTRTLTEGLVHSSNSRNHMLMSSTDSWGLEWLRPPGASFAACPFFRPTNRLGVFEDIEGLELPNCSQRKAGQEEEGAESERA